MTVTFDQLLKQAKVEMDAKGLYLVKAHRTCEAVARVFVAVRAMIDSAAQSEIGHEQSISKLARENSRLAAELADRERQVADAQRSAIRRGLEAIPEISQNSRDRLLTVNGG